MLVVSFFNADLRKEVNFSKSMIRDFKHFFQNSDIPVPTCGSMYRNHVDQTFFEIGSEDLKNDTLFYRFLIFRLRIDPGDLLDDMI